MLTVLWSTKGGVGVSVTAAIFAVGLAESAATRDPGAGSCLLLDSGGDLPAILGEGVPDGGSFADWLNSPVDVAFDSLRRVEAVTSRRLSYLAVGDLASSTASIERLRLGLRLLRHADRPTIIDLGRVDLASTGDLRESFVREVFAFADVSLLVTTPCYLALRRAQHYVAEGLVQATGVVVVDQPERALRSSDVEAALGLPVVCTVPYAAPIARAVDAGLLQRRLPQSARRPARWFAEADRGGSL